MDQKAIDRIRKLAKQAENDPEAREKLWKRTNEYLNKRKAESSVGPRNRRFRPTEARITDLNYRPRVKR